MTFNEEYALWIEFIDPSPSFTHGWECGEIYRDMRSGKDINRTVHAVNQGQIELMANKLGYKLVFQVINGYEEWLQMEAEKTIRRVK